MNGWTAVGVLLVSLAILGGLAALWWWALAGIESEVGMATFITCLTVGTVGAAMIIIGEDL